MYHATINIGDTVAVGIQKKKATIPEMKLQYEGLCYSDRAQHGYSI